MSQNKRVLIGLLVLVVIIFGVLGLDTLRRLSPVSGSSAEVTLAPGSIPVYFNGKLVAGFTPEVLAPLDKVSFTEPVEGVLQEGWLLRDVILLFIPASELKADTPLVVSSASRGKSARLTWGEVQAQDNMVMFDLSNRGTLKLVSKGLEKLDTRDEWVQDVDKIEVGAP
jgi:hypothetical protein